MNLSVVCVYWEGDFRKRTYSVEWVRRTARMIKRALPDADFCCLSNNPDVPGYIPLRHNWPGWWSKIEVFRADIPFEGRILYLDLDVLITGSLYDIASYSAPIAFCPPSYKFNGGRAVGGPGIVDRYNSSVFVFDKGQGQRIYEEFDEISMSKFRGDQDWIGYIAPCYDTLPHKWFRKLKDCPNGPPPGTRVVFSMPWKNDVAAKKFPWVGEIWK